MDLTDAASATNNDRSITNRERLMANTAQLARPRRLSDPSTLSNASPTSRSIPVRSKDGTRWLPTPDEQLHRRGGPGEQEQSMSDATEGPSLSQHFCSAAVCTVMKTFETTELLESILSYLDTPDVLSLQLVNKHWRSTVQASPYLRLHFFTYPQWERPGSQYQVLPINIPGVKIEEDEPIHLGQWIKVTLTREAARRICPNPRQRVRSRSIFEGMRGGLGRSSNDMWPASNATATDGGCGVSFENLQITQPPLLGMQAYLVHQSGAKGSRPNLDALSGEFKGDDAPIAKCSCDSGVTLGFLAETAQELIGTPLSGPSSAGDVRVVFKAIVSFCEADASSRRGSRRNISRRTVTRLG